MADAKPRDKLDLLFKLCDEDPDGKLSLEELKKTLKALLSAVSALQLNKQPKEITEKFRLQLAENVMDQADADGSGSIEKGEFTKFVENKGGTGGCSEFIESNLLGFLRPKV